MGGWLGAKLDPAHDADVNGVGRCELALCGVHSAELAVYPMPPLLPGPCHPHSSPNTFLPTPALRAMCNAGVWLPPHL